MRWRRPQGLLQLDTHAGVSLARLTGVEGFARAVIVGVIPLSALEALGSKEAVSYSYLGGAVLTILITLNVGALERRLERRGVVNLAGALLVIAAIMFIFAEGALYAVAIGLRSAEASIFSVCLSLYIMDHIGKGELVANESRRMIYTGGAWLLGPSLGVWLWDHTIPAMPFLLSAGSAVLLLLYFWRLRLVNDPVLSSRATQPPPGPLVAIPRFFRRRHMRVAYIITTARAVFWALLFIYGPIYVVEADLPTWVAGAFLSTASAMLFVAPAVLRLSDRFGVRAVIVAAFALMTVSMLALAALGDAEPVGLVFWLVASVGGAMLDVLGNVPFMRTVKPRERTEMTTVFSTWREMSFLVAPAIAAVVLAVGPFWAVYLVLAALLAGAGAASTLLPRRL